MKVRFYVNLFPGYDPKYLSAVAQNNSDFSNIPHHKKFAFDVELPSPDELIPVDHILEAGPAEEVKRGEG